MGRVFRFLVVFLLGAVSLLSAGELEREVGRAETRVRSEAFPLFTGCSVARCALLERLDALGYSRVRRRPELPGEYFYGHEAFWIYRRPHRYRGRDYPATPIGLRLERGTGVILGAIGKEGETLALDARRPSLWLEPETLAESLDGRRARRRPIEIGDLPDHVWRPLLAAEDARFFDHVGVDARALARAAIANVKKGGVAQGGSTITQQLVKNRDLTPKRTLGRKLSEAIRALAIEAEYDKQEILEAYLNQVYYGQHEGWAIHGIGAAAHVFFGKEAEELSLAQSALLAGIIQAPNRLSPLRHPARARERRDWVLGRLRELRWVPESEVDRALASGLSLDATTPVGDAPRHLVGWLAEQVDGLAPDRRDSGRGVVVESTIDPQLQRFAEEAVVEGLDRVRRRHGSLRRGTLQAALVALDARDGAVLAYVGGDPTAAGDRFDRVRKARRQPGSTIKPFILLEAFESCGSRKPVPTSARVVDEPLRIELDRRTWSPENFDREFRGAIDLRTALIESRNVPMVRVARHCGFEATAARMRRAGLDLPADLPPSFSLGTIETTPLELVRAYTLFAAGGRVLEPRSIARLEKPGGGLLDRGKARRNAVAHASSAYLVDWLMTEAVREGTARGAGFEEARVAAKTGSSSDLRDAWLAGHAGSIVTVVWVGFDDGKLGLTGGQAAAPIWRGFMERAVPARPPHEVKAPSDVVELCLDSSGRALRRGCPDDERVPFRRRAAPPRKRRLRRGEPVPLIR